MVGGVVFFTFIMPTLAEVSLYHWGTASAALAAILSRLELLSMPRKIEQTAKIHYFDLQHDRWSLNNALQHTSCLTWFLLAISASPGYYWLYLYHLVPINYVCLT
jgi:hypothetical protein